MKTLILNPSSLQTGNVIRDATYGCWCKGKRIGGASTPPLPLLQIATVLSREGHDVRLIDSQAEQISFDQLKDLVKEFQAVIILTSVMTYDEDADILLQLKSAHPTLITIVYGSQPTFQPEATLEKKGVDIIIRFEAEHVLRDLLAALDKNDSSWKDIRGIGFKEADSIIVREPYPFIENLDELPFVRWEFLPKEAKYFNPLIKRYPYVTMLTSRGCAYRCVYCMAPAFYGKRFRFRSIANVLQELAILKEKGVREIYFRDELFTVSKERTRQFCEGLLAQKLDLTWICSSRVDTVDKALLTLMKQAGCHTIKFGVESGMQEILDNAKKDITIEQTKRVFTWTNELRINTHAHVMVGLPLETEESLAVTSKFLRELNPTTVDIGIMTPFPGTPIYEEVKRKYPSIETDHALNLKTLHNRSFYADAICRVSNETIERWIKKMHRMFYLRPGYILGSLSRIRSFRDIRTLFLAGLNVIGFSVFGED